MHCAHALFPSRISCMMTSCFMSSLGLRPSMSRSSTICCMVEVPGHKLTDAISSMQQGPPQKPTLPTSVTIALPQSPAISLPSDWKHQLSIAPVNPCGSPQLARGIHLGRVYEKKHSLSMTQPKIKYQTVLRPRSRPTGGHKHDLFTEA